MGRKKHKDEPESVNPAPQSGAGLQEPEFFDCSLLKQPPAVRQRYFKDECIIEHPYLEKALDDILHAICSPGKKLDLKRLGLMALVIGPTRVGKTTLIKKLQEKLSERAKKRMLSDPDFIPFAFIDLHGSGRFEWIGFYKAVLRQLRDPFLDLRIASLRTRDFLEAMEEALIRRKPYAVIVDEAQHLAKAASDRMRQEQLDQLKSIENRTGELAMSWLAHMQCGLSERPILNWPGGASTYISRAMMLESRRRRHFSKAYSGHCSGSFP